MMTILSTAKEYIRQYPERLDKFIYEYEATETDFIDEELEKLENVLIDLDRIKTSTSPDIDMEFSYSGYPVISEVVKYIETLGENGFKKFYFATKRKIQFLEDKKKPGQHKLEEPPTFESLFIEKGNAKRVKELFERNHYTEGGKWAANPDKYSKHTGNKTELLAAYYSLRNKGHILKPGKPTPQARVFYKEFGLKVGEYIQERNFRTEPAPGHIEVFNKLFVHIE